MSPRLQKTAASFAALLAVALLPSPRLFAGTEDDFTTGNNLNTTSSYSAGYPNTSSDILLLTPTSSLLLTASLGIESLNVTNGSSYTITNSATGTTSNTLTVSGGSFNNPISGADRDSIYVGGGSTLTLAAGNSSTGSGSLGIIVNGNANNFDVAANSTLNIGATISNTGSTASGFVKTGTGTLNLTGTNAYTGTTTLAGGTLNLDYLNVTTGNRLNDSSSLTIGSGTLNLLGNANAATTEAVNTLTFGAGGSTVVISPGSGQLATLSAATLGTRVAGSVVTFNSANLGTSATTGSHVTFAIAPTISGLGTPNATVLTGVVAVDPTGSTTPTFVTYDTNGVRALNASEQQATFTGATTATNVRLTLAGATASIPSGTTTVQSLQIDNTTGAASVVTNSATAGAFTASAGILFTGNSPTTLGGTALSAGGGEAIIISNSTALTTISTPIGSSGSPLSNLTIGGSGNIRLTGAPSISNGTFGNSFNYVGTGTLQVATSLGSYGGSGRFFNVYSGTVQLQTGGDVGQNPVVRTAPGATLDLNGLSIASSPLSDLNGGGTITNANTTTQSIIGNSFFNSFSYSGSITGNIQFNFKGSTGGTFQTLNGTNTFTGGVNFTNNGSTSGVIFKNDAALGSATGTVAGTRDNIVFNSSGASGVNVATTTTIDSRRTMGIGPTTGTGTGSYTGGISTNANGTTLTYNGTIEPTTTGGGVANTGTQNLIVNGVVNGTPTGTVILGGVSTYNGSTTLAQGTLSINSINGGGATAGSAIGQPTAGGGQINLGNTTTTNAATLVYTGAAATTDRVLNLAGTTGGVTLTASGTGALAFTSNATAGGAGAKTLTLNGTNTGLNTLTALPDSSGGATSLTKSGAGTWALAGTNAYTGATTLTAGTLLVNGSTAGSVFTGAAGTTLGGRGTIGGAVTTAGNIAPGSSGPGILTLTSSVTFNTGSNAGLTAVLNGTAVGTEYSQLAANGVTINGGALTLGLGYTAVQGDMFTLINNTSANAIVGTFTNVADGGTYTVGGTVFTANYEGGTGNDLVLTVTTGAAVPEPGTALASLMGLALIGWNQRRRLARLFGRAKV